MFMQESQPAVKGWLETIKDKLRLDEIAEKLNISLDTIGQGALWFGIGFLSGFLIKRYGRYVLLAALVCAGVIWGLSHFEVVTFHADKLRELVGFATSDTVASVLTSFGVWAKEHIIETIGCVFGLFLGHKVG